MAIQSNHDDQWIHGDPEERTMILAVIIMIAMSPFVIGALSASPLKAAEVPDSFHPRYDAIAKTYEYRILRAEICPPFDRRFVYHYPYLLDEANMIAVARVR